MASFVKFEGGRELEKLLHEMSTKSAQRVGRAALRQVATAVLKDARPRVPVKEGRLRKALRLRVDRARTDKALISALIYVSATAFDHRLRTTFRKTMMHMKRDCFNKVDHGYGYAACGPSQVDHGRRPWPTHRCAVPPAHDPHAALPSPTAWVSCCAAADPTPCKACRPSWRSRPSLPGAGCDRDGDSRSGRASRRSP